ncbi:hypothetical protein HPB50_017328 [Hyalomma asiaticum]|uniref:Uncharacterized protein n=1 Tax=Hyalomma asiaticum TaxID=266040 RepID=A0ACB7S760_HYAAI|nr:hypothetical protein HPB50_017328 [Hyalomma asiaticum]
MCETGFGDTPTTSAPREVIRLEVRTARSEGDVCSSVEVSWRRRHYCADFEEFGRHRKNGTRSAQRPPGPASERVKGLEYLVDEKEAA